jgi:hypothetical protein
MAGSPLGGRESCLHLEPEEGSRIVIGLELKPEAAHPLDAGAERRLAA